MASEERSIPPSEHKLEQLRKSGQIPFSPELITFAACAALPLSLLLLTAALRERVPPLFDQLRQPEMAVKSGKITAEFFQAAASAAATGLVAGAGIVAVAIFLVGAVQNRFLVTFEPLGFNVRNLLGSNPFAGMGSRLLTALVHSVLALGCIAAGYLAVQQLLSENVDRYRETVSSRRMIVDDESIAIPGEAPPTGFAMEREIARAGVWAGAAELQAGVSGLVVPILVAVFFVGVFARIAAGILFSRSHRMTRAEAEAEARETESSPQFRQARQSRYAEE